MGDAEEVDISAVDNLLLHGDARDTSSSRFVGISNARRVLANTRWKTNPTGSSAGSRATNLATFHDAVDRAKWFDDNAKQGKRPGRKDTRMQ